MQVTKAALRDGTAATHDQPNHEENQEHDEQDLSNARSRACKAEKTECARNQRDDQKS